MKSHILKKGLPWAILFVFLGLNVFLLVFFIQGRDPIEEESGKEAGQVYRELASLETLGLQSFGELAKYFTSLAKEKGGAYAFEVLKRAPIAPDIDMHLLAHTVGDILYQQEGVDGIKICTQDFRNACSHSIVVGLFLEQGEGALPQIAKACYEAPGGSGAYTMCFHGLGHGVLAYSGYNLEKATVLCKKTGTPGYNYRESVECIGGTIMEMIGGGAHDPVLWLKQRPKYFADENPLYPCSGNFIPEEAKYMCYVYLTPHLFEAAGADLARPLAADYKRAFPFCNEIPASEPQNRDACYGGFGKEFVVLAQDRDIRNVASMGDEQMKNIYAWCLFADNKDGVISCIKHATNSLYWGGENNRNAAIRFCGLIQNPDYQNSCFVNLIGAVQTYIRDPDYKSEFCSELPVSYQEKCKFYLL